MTQAETARGWGEAVTVEVTDGVAWVTLNRPDKRNAINPAIVREMTAVLDALEGDPAAEVLVITGAGEAFSAGQDLKEYFRETEGWPPHERERLFAQNAAWQWRRLMHYRKPTIAMVNGWCFGGAFQVLVGCDLAITAEDATFGLSEINWGIIPAGIVTKSVSMVMPQRDAMYYIMTGETFDGRQAAEMRLVNRAVPREALRGEVEKLAATLRQKNPHVLRAAKSAYHHVRQMGWEQALEYLMAKADATKFRDPEQGDVKGMAQFIDEKRYKPGLGAYDRDS
ncbi:p-hydroxycinnamoyl CoA hydratase/lyase [Wenxinia marina]|uniref:Vanillin synthase/trans-feruloyl-CoA hydratase n=1 Tax=Wenxinia marina DSM 24838 TaxID=1123501 RepID=A0A0D0QBI1_9RHOB|nr:p-hydroxycinnamoyl CoA hydratase/lyase [Wenxinia marina]KIQ68293.1 vanillin synthase/trans-feruloyl-CoA hydratase [Wenxinia marina DSM 24838]GGL79509.1 p-hydroxycinnamoyl CoA hydratase/lyase [Wenxinia marina]